MRTTDMIMSGMLDDVSFDGVNTGVTGSNNYSTPSNAPTKSSGNGFWGGTNFMGLLNTIGGTWAQIERAKSGQQVIVKDANGQATDIAPQLLHKLEQQAQANQTSVDNLMKMMQMQMMQKQNQDKPKKNNTALYVGLGVGALVLIGGIFLVTGNNKKK